VSCNQGGLSKIGVAMECLDCSSGRLHSLKITESEACKYKEFGRKVIRKKERKKEITRMIVLVKNKTSRTFSVAILGRSNNSSVQDVAKLGKNVNEIMTTYICAKTL
jgi:hypothetical protein